MAEVQLLPLHQRSWSKWTWSGYVPHLQEVSRLILALERENQKLITEKSNPAETAERYASCYESVGRIVLLLFDYLDIPVKPTYGIQDSQDIHGAFLENLASPKKPLYLFLDDGPAYAFLDEANVSRKRWKNRPRKDKSILHDTPTKQSMVDGFKRIIDWLRSALQASRKT